MNNQQPALIEVVEDDGILFSPEQRAKRFTAAQCEKLEWKENAILELIARDCPVKRIARLLSVSDHTVTVLVMRHSEKVATFSQEYADQLLKKGARLVSLGLLKEDELSPFQAITCGAILTDKAVVVANGAGMGLSGGKEFVKEPVDRVAAAAALRRMVEEDLARQVAEPSQPAPASEPAEANGELGAPQPVVSCGVESEERADITLEQKGKTPTKPA